MLKSLLGAALAAAAILLAPVSLAATSQLPADSAYADPLTVTPSGDVLRVTPDGETITYRAGTAAAEEARLTQYTPDQTVELPWGDWISAVIKALGSVILLIAAYLFRKLPQTAVSALDMIAGALGQGRANELLEKAVNYGINVTAGAAQGKTLNVHVGNEVLERALEYAIDKAPWFVKTFLGGAEAVRAMIIARLNLDESVSLPSKQPVAGSLVVERVEPDPRKMADPSPVPAPAQ